MVSPVGKNVHYYHFTFQNDVDIIKPNNQATYITYKKAILQSYTIFHFIRNAISENQTL